jgi:hypothetical protein
MKRHQTSLPACLTILDVIGDLLADGCQIEKSCLMKASSVFSASFRYMTACCRKYSSQSMFVPRKAMNVSCLSVLWSAHSNPHARCRTMGSGSGRSRYHSVSVPALGSILIGNRNEFRDCDRQVLLLNVLATRPGVGERHRLSFFAQAQ